MQKHHKNVIKIVLCNIPGLLKSYAVYYIVLIVIIHTSVLLARVHRPVELPLKLLSLRHMDIIKDLLMHHVCLPEKIMHTNTKPEHFFKSFSSHISVFSVIDCCIDLYTCMSHTQCNDQMSHSQHQKSNSVLC